MPDPLIVPLHSRRRRRVRTLQELQDAIPAGALLLAGAQRLGAGASGVRLGLALFEVVTSVLLLATLVRRFRRPSRGPASPEPVRAVDWGQVWAALLLFAEALERWVNAHDIALAVILLAMLTLFAGLHHGSLERVARRRRSLTITDEGLVVGGPRWRIFRATWAQLADISIGSAEARVRKVTGAKRRIDFGDLENAGEVRAALQLARERLKAAAASSPLVADPVERH